MTAIAGIGIAASASTKESRFVASRLDCFVCTRQRPPGGFGKLSEARWSG